jgi:hypothetical protein
MEKFTTGEASVRAIQGTLLEVVSRKKVMKKTEFIKCKFCEVVLGEKGKENREFCDYLCKRFYKATQPKVVKKVKIKKEWFRKVWL